MAGPVAVRGRRDRPNSFLLHLRGMLYDRAAALLSALIRLRGPCPEARGRQWCHRLIVVHWFLFAGVLAFAALYGLLIYPERARMEARILAVFFAVAGMVELILKGYGLRPPPHGAT